MPLTSFPSLAINANNSVRSLKVLKRSKIVPLPTASPDELCCICLHLYGPSHRAVTVLIKDCYHRFGEGCLDEYLNSESPQNNTCPQCRREWYKRQSPRTAPRDMNTIDALASFSQLRAHVRSEPRARAHRTQRTLEQDQTTNNGIITNHLDEVFRRLDLIQAISNEQVTSTADTRVRLQAVERRARRINQDFQTRYENMTVQAPQSLSFRGSQSRWHPTSSGYAGNTARRRWIDAFMTEIEDDPYSLTARSDGMDIFRNNRITLPRIPFVSSELPRHFEAPSNTLSDTHSTSLSPIPGTTSTLIGELPPQRRQAIDTVADLSYPSQDALSMPSRQVNTSSQPPTTSSSNTDRSSRGDVAGAADPSPVPRARNSASRSTRFGSRSVSDMNIDESTRNALPTLCLRAPNSSSAFASVRTSDGITPTRATDTPNLPLRRPNRGSFMEIPTLRPSPSIRGRSSTSIMERGSDRSRNTAQSRGNYRWLPSVPRISNVSSLRHQFSRASLRDAAISEPPIRSNGTPNWSRSDSRMLINTLH